MEFSKHTVCSTYIQVDDQDAAAYSELLERAKAKVERFLSLTPDFMGALARKVALDNFITEYNYEKLCQGEELDRFTQEFAAANASLWSLGQASRRREARSRTRQFWSEEVKK